MRKGGLKGALKGGSKWVPKDEIQVTAPGTFFTSAATGIGKRGIDLDRCYKGEYKDGLRHGQGSYKYANGYMTYEGEYVMGKKHGKGKMRFKDGGYYEGDFKNDEMTGQGTRRFANGSTFIGTFYMGEMHGSGMLIFKSMDTYEGPMEHNKMHGKGLYRFRNGDVYKGDFQDNHMTGQGVMEFNNGDRYDGQWVDGKRVGQGRCTYSNGDNYRGTWEDDQFNGQGMLSISALGIRYRGIFIDGKPSQLPTKLNLFWMETPEEIKARLAPKKPVPKGGVAPEEPPPVLQNTLGTPLPAPLLLAAQLEAPIPKDTATPPTTPPAKAAPAPTTAKAQAAAAAALAAATPPEPIYSEKPRQSDMQWQTADMEYGRIANVTLHASPPAPTTEERPLGVTLATTLLQDGTVTLRVLLLPVILDKPLPMRRLEDGSPIYGLEVYLDAGKHSFENLVIGDPADFDVLQNQAGVGYLVASCQWGLTPGYCRVTLPDAKAKNPNEVAAKPAKK